MVRSDSGTRVFHPAHCFAAPPTEFSSRRRFADDEPAVDEAQILVIALSYHSSIAFRSPLASVHRHYASDIDAHHHIDHQLRFCQSRVCSQLAILEQEV